MKSVFTITEINTYESNPVDAVSPWGVSFESMEAAESALIEFVESFGGDEEITKNSEGEYECADILFLVTEVHPE